MPHPPSATNHFAKDKLIAFQEGNETLLLNPLHLGSQFWGSLTMLVCRLLPAYDGEEIFQDQQPVQEILPHESKSSRGLVFLLHVAWAAESAQQKCM